MSRRSAGLRGEKNEQLFETILTLADYPHDEVWLCPYYTRRTELETPFELKIK